MRRKDRTSIKPAALGANDMNVLTDSSEMSFSDAYIYAYSDCNHQPSPLFTVCMLCRLLA